jgi:hypothetical protein
VSPRRLTSCDGEPHISPGRQQSGGGIRPSKTGKVVGRWYEENLTHRGAGVEWDAFFLYRPKVSWDETPPQVVAWGQIILSNKERLREGLDRLLE